MLFRFATGMGRRVRFRDVPYNDQGIDRAEFYTSVIVLWNRFLDGIIYPIHYNLCTYLSGTGPVPRSFFQLISIRGARVMTALMRYRSSFNCFF